jgi:DEAD/DEAH box helicase domain-containing protein
MTGSPRIEDLLDGLERDPSIDTCVTAHRHVPPRRAEHSSLTVREEIREVLRTDGIEDLYSHQAAAITEVRRGHNVLVMTPTASGKSLVYNIPVIEAVLANPEARALYLFPLKGLEQDQVKNLDRLLQRSMSAGSPGQLPSPEGDGSGRRRGRGSATAFAEVYDGDTTPYRRKKIRERPPRAVFTNPDMLHLAINPYHRKWEPFLRNLRYVIIDEIHTYRGVFGSHVSHILRRFRRICRHWGSDPQFIACSATIANPAEVAERLVGLPFSVIDRTGAPQPGRHFLMLQPSESPYTVATRVFLESIGRGFRTILFTKARRITELIYQWSVERAPHLADRISPYRAGFLPSERRKIEQRLFGGDLIGVISTSALELGVDIGGLDVCILCGYPGSVSSTWQRAGRVGRKGQESLVVMVALRDALDQYIVSHPEAFFDKPHEASICDPGNRAILKQHLLCAADEITLRDDDPVYDVNGMTDLIDEMISEGTLRSGPAGGIWLPAVSQPQRQFEIRSIGRPLKLKDEGGRHIADLDGRRIFREAFPGAIYLHRGKSYEVRELDLQQNEARCREAGVTYFTRALSQEQTEILGTSAESAIPLNGAAGLYSGPLRITCQVIGYERKSLYEGRILSRHGLDMPSYVFTTEGIWLVIGQTVAGAIRKAGHDLAGTLHAAEHVMISAMPLFGLCDKGDIGGMSYTAYPGWSGPVIFAYDGCEGGIGLTRRALEVPVEWVRASAEIIQRCDCEEGCPSCVQDSQCGSSNNPLDKEGALMLLRGLLPPAV